MAAYEYIVNTGTIVPNTVDIRTDVQQEYLGLFGSNLSLNPATPQGLLITAETTARDSVARNNAKLANQINPRLAGGIYLDAIGALTNTVRKGNSYSVITGVAVTGIPGTTLPQGSIAQTTAGFNFQTTGSVTFNTSGSGVVNFQATQVGAVPVEANTLTIIAPGAPLNWETVNNPNAGTVGSTEESDEEFRTSRTLRLGIQGTGQSESVISSLLALSGVTDVLFRENVASTTQVIDGVTMVSHSIFVCVDGGLDSEIAATLSSVKNSGSAYNGAVTVPYIDPYSGQTIQVKFSRPAIIPVAARITVSSASVTSIPDPTQTIVGAIMSYALGLLPQERGLKMGVPVSPFEFSGAINQVAPSIFVKTVEVAYQGGTPVYQTTSLPIEIYQKAEITPGVIQVIYV